MMKKVLFVLLCGVMLVSITGCGSDNKNVDKSQNNNSKENNSVTETEKKSSNILTCKYSNRINHMVGDSVYTFTFNDDISKLETMHLKHINTWDEDYWEDRMEENEVKNIKVDNEKKWGNNPYVTTNVTSDGNVITNELTYTINDSSAKKLTEDPYFKEIKDFYNDYSKIKEYYESVNFSCE